MAKEKTRYKIEGSWIIIPLSFPVPFPSPALHCAMNKDRKPLGRKNYGHIPHLPGSRMGPGDHKCHEGQKKIATSQKRDRHDFIIVQEKLDGSNVGVAKIDNVIYPLTRAGYIADTSRYEQHWKFANWVYENQDRFLALLNNGERVCGEWLLQAHGTRYNLPHEPFVAFDIMIENKRLIFNDFLERVGKYNFVVPKVLHKGEPLSIEAMLKLIKISAHGAIDPVEGAVWRIERNFLNNKIRQRTWKVDFLVKYVRPNKKDGIYLPEVSGEKAVWNSYPDS